MEYNLSNRLESERYFYIKLCSPMKENLKCPLKMRVTALRNSRLHQIALFQSSIS